MTDALRLALGTLTRWPVAPPNTVNRHVARRAIALSPLVGGLIAASAALPAWLLSWAFGKAALTSLLIAVLAVSWLAVTTRALHFDGLADTADALGSGRPAEQALQIARRSDIGPFGVVTLVLTLGLQVAGLATAIESGAGPAALMLAVVGARVALVWACTPLLPAARRDGLGVAFAATVPVPIAIGWGLLIVIAAGWWQPKWLWAVLLAAVISAVLLRSARRRLGGVTGDVLGATVEVATAALLVGAAFSA